MHRIGTQKENNALVILSERSESKDLGTDSAVKATKECLGLPENVKPYSIVGVGYPAEDADLEAVDRFDAGRIHYNKY